MFLTSLSANTRQMPVYRHHPLHELSTDDEEEERFHAGVDIEEGEEEGPLLAGKSAATMSCWSSAIESENGVSCPTVYTNDEFSADEDNENEEEAETEAKARYFNIINRPSAVNLVQDKTAIRGWKQERANARLAGLLGPVSRQDHHIMLRILIGQAYGFDPKRKENRKRWCRVMSSMSNRFDGAAAILSWSPDPYPEVVGSLSRMRLWSHSQRKWDLNTLPYESRARDIAILEKLRKSGKLFLDEVE